MKISRADAISFKSYNLVITVETEDDESVLRSLFAKDITIPGLFDSLTSFKLNALFDKVNTVLNRQ